MLEAMTTPPWSTVVLLLCWVLAALNLAACGANWWNWRQLRRARNSYQVADAQCRQLVDVMGAQLAELGKHDAELRVILGQGTIVRLITLPPDPRPVSRMKVN